MKTTTIFCALALICAVAVAQTVDPSSPCKAYPDLGVDLSTLKGQGPMGPYNFTSSNIFGPSSIYIDICGNNGVIVSGTGGPARLNGPLISTANMSGAFLDKGYMVFTYRNPNIYRRHCGPAGVSFQMEVRCDQTTSQREEFSSSGHSFCNLMVTVWTASACPALPPTVPEDTTPFTDVWQPKTICRGGFERGIDLSSLYGLSSPVFFKWNTVPGTVYPCGNPRTGSLLDIVSAKHGPVTMAKLDNLIAKNQTENGLSFTFRGTDDSAFCMRRGKPMVQVVFECPQPEDDGQQGGNDSTLEDDGDWAIKVSDLWGERCFVRVKVSTKFACPKQ